MIPIRVLLADDCVLFRQGLASLLAAESDFEVVGEAIDGLQALKMARDLMPDVILMDVSMPVMNGLEATRRIKAEMPYVRIVILTVSDGESTLLEAIQSGAQAYLPHKREPQELFGVLRAVARGGAPVSQTMAARLLEEFSRRAERPSAAELTLREREILEQVARGRSNEEIAAALAIAAHAVRNHLTNVLEKVHFESRAQAAAPALR